MNLSISYFHTHWMRRPADEQANRINVRVRKRWPGVFFFLRLVCVPHEIGPVTADKNNKRTIIILFGTIITRISHRVRTYIILLMKFFFFIGFEKKISSNRVFRGDTLRDRARGYGMWVSLSISRRDLLFVIINDDCFSLFHKREYRISLRTNAPTEWKRISVLISLHFSSLPSLRKHKRANTQVLLETNATTTFNTHLRIANDVQYCVTERCDYVRQQSSRLNRTAKDDNSLFNSVSYSFREKKFFWNSNP